VAAERLQKVMAAAGVASRRGSEALIGAGRVTVDGVVAVIGQRVDGGVSRILVDGRPLARPAARVHVALHKPIGVTSTVRDSHADRTVVDVLPADLKARTGPLYPVGRLDRDSEGLLLLTNDGAWAEQVLHPRYEVEREYAIGVAAALTTEQRGSLERGIELEEGTAVIEHLRLSTQIENRGLVDLMDPRPARLIWYRGTLRQGWKRQLRRMFAAVGMPVERLVRVRIGTLRMGELRSGEARELSPAEGRRLAALAARAQPKP